MKTPPRSVLSILVLAVLALPGCLAVAAAAGAGAGVLYTQGNLSVLMDGTPQQVRDAGEAALKDLDIAVLSAEATAVDASIIGRTAKDTRVSITATSQAGDSCKVVIRVGLFGDESVSTLIHEGMQKRL